MPDRTAGPSARDRGAAARLVSAGAVMAAGTALSRVLGFFRLMLLAYLFGNTTRQAEMFNIANQLPNSMYILLAGGVLNTVLVPQLIRAVKTDPDRGEAYTNRIMTLGLLGLGLITVALTLAVPGIIHLYSDGGWREPALAAQYQSMIVLGYYCMPQVFFYGVHVLAGQVLNSRDKFGPMMWAPIANNVVSIAVLTLFLLVFGSGNTAKAFTSGQEMLLGLGATLGIAAQAAVLVPFLKQAGYRFRPRFDLLHTGLGKTFHLAKWTLGFVLVTQLALVVVTRLASGATVGGEGAGLTAYIYAYAVWILPHSLVTVSLATAMLSSASRMAAEGDHAGVAEETMRTIRLAVTALLPVAVGFLVLGVPLGQLVFGFGEGAGGAVFVGTAIMALAVGLVPFTVQYICLRAFYALEDTRTTFWLQCLIAAGNVTFGLIAVLLFDNPTLVATGLGLAYSLAYVVGVLVSFRQLGRRLPGLSPDALLRHCIRLIAAVLPAAAAAWLIVWGITGWSGSRWALAFGLALAGAAAILMFLVTARILRISEVTQILGALRNRGAAPNDRGWVAGKDKWITPGDSRGPRVTERDTIGPATTTADSEHHAAGPIEDAEGMAQAILIRTDGDEVAAGAADSPSPAPAGAALSPARTMLPTGTVLAARYRLEELVAESAPTVSWRATDLVLSRSVLLHLLPPGAPEEAELLAAARRASVATDSRFLRVLDVVHSADPEVGSYIVCEFAAGQSLDVILSHGPLSGLEAAWVVREVGDAIAGAHALGLYHRQINPATVIITPSGNVKLAGLLIESSLHPPRSGVVHGADTPEHVDVTDLGRLLYASLVGRWPGGPAYGLPDAPVVGRHWMTPRQVRAGVSLPLDTVCDLILGDPPRHHAEVITSVGGVVTALTKVLGTADASADLERRLRQPIPRVGGKAGETRTLLDQAPAVIARPRAYAPPNNLPRVTTVQVGPAGARAGSRTGSRTGSELSPGPGGPARPPQHPTPRQRGAARRRVGVLLILTVLLITAGVLSAVTLLDRIGVATPLPADPSSVNRPNSSTPNRTTALTIAGGRDFDPQGDPSTENPREVPLAYDGNPQTRWRTMQYLGTPKLGNLKRGVGVVLDLGGTREVREVRVTLSGGGTDLDVRIPKTDPATIAKPPMSSDSKWRVVAQASKARAGATLTPKDPVSTRYVLVYLTSLPKEGGGYRGGIAEVSVLGG